MFKLCVLTRWDFHFCIRSSPLRGSAGQEKSKFTNFKRPHLNYDLFKDFQGLENGRSFSQTFTDLSKNLVLTNHVWEFLCMFSSAEVGNITASQSHFLSCIEGKCALICHFSQLWSNLWQRHEAGQGLKLMFGV